MPDTLSESIVLDFDGWLGGQPPEVRSGIDAHLKASGPNAGLEKKRLASMFAVAEDTGLPLATVNEKWDIVRGGYAEKRGGDWGAVKDDEDAFHGRLFQDVKERRETRVLAESYYQTGGRDALQLNPPDRMETEARVQADAASEMAKPEGAARLVNAYRTARAAMEAKAGPYRPVAKFVRGMLENQAAKKYTGDDGAEDFGMALDSLADVPDDALPHVFAMIKGPGAGADAAGKGTGQKAVENVERGFISRLRGFSSNARREGILRVKTILDTSPDLKIFGSRSIEDTYKTMSMQAVGDPLNARDFRAANQAEVAKLRELADADLRRNVLAGKLVNLAEQNIDPAAGSGMLERSLYGAANSVGAMVPAFIPYAGLMVQQGAFADDEFNRQISNGTDPQTAHTVSQITGTVQAGLDRAQAIFAIKLPGLASSIPRAGNAALRVGGAVAGVQAAEYAIETAQDGVPVVVSALAGPLGWDLPEQAQYTEEMKRWKVWNPEMFMTLLPLSLLGGGYQGIQNTTQARNEQAALTADPVGMQAVGVPPVEAGRIAALPEAERTAAYQAAYTKRDPSTPEAAAAQQAVADRTAASIAEGQQAIAEMQDAGLSITRTPDGFAVVDNEAGTSINAPDATEAMTVARGIMTERGIQKDETFLDALDEFTGIMKEGRTIELSDRVGTLLQELETATVDGKEKTVQAIWDRADEYRASRGEEALAREMENPDSRDALEGLLVLGRSTTQAKGNAARSVSLIMQGGGTLDLVEEQAENDLREAVAAGKTSLATMRGILKRIEAATGDNYINIDTETGITEAWSSLVRLYTTGTRKEGNRITAGSRKETAADLRSLRRRLKEAEGNGTAPAAFSKLREYYQQVRAMLGQVARLMKARQEGKLDDVEAMIRESLGLKEQDVHEAAVAEAVPVDYNLPEGWDTTEDVGFSVKNRAQPADLSKRTIMPDGAELIGPTSFSIRAYHGTPHKVDKFSTDAIGTGEGNQSYGWGLYFAQNRAVAGQYAKDVKDSSRIASLNSRLRELSGIMARDEVPGSYRQYRTDAGRDAAEEYDRIMDERSSVVGASGNIYTVDLLPDEADFLDYDKPLSEQSPKVQAALEKLREEYREKEGAPGTFYIPSHATGEKIYNEIWQTLIRTGKAEPAKVKQQKASQKLAALGIPGIRFLDAGSRDGSAGTRNFVIFDEKLVKILEENGMPADGDGESVGFSVQQRRFLPGNYPDSLATVITSTRVGTLTAHPDYDEAKRGGSGAAAESVVFDTLKPKAIEALREIIAGRKVTYVPVMHRDGGKRDNALPMLLALKLEDEIGGDISTDIGKISGNANTGAGVEARFANEQHFDGPVTKGGLYVVVDDNHTSGDTLAALIDHIHEGGGEVIAATALAHSQSQNYLKARPQDAAKLLDLTGLDEVGFAREYGSPITALTGSEIYRLANLGPRGKSAAEFRGYVRSRISPGGSTPDHGGRAGSDGRPQSEERVGFSITTADRLESLARVVATKARNPEERLLMYQQAADRLSGMARSVAFNDGALGAVSTREIERQRIERRRESLERAYQEIEADFGDLSGTEFVSRATNNPVIAELVRFGPGKTGLPKGRLKSRSKNQVGGEYDGSEELPRWLFGGTLAPDNAAQELYDAGLLSEPSTDAMWKAVNDALVSTGAAKDRLQKHAERRREAREQAATEASEWADAELADLPNRQEGKSRRDMLRFLQALDTILMPFPVEVRAKVGGFIKLASLGTNAAMERYIIDRVATLDRELERFLQQEYRKSIQKIFDKGEVKVGENRVPKGKLTPQAQADIDKAHAYSELSIQEAEVQTAAAEAVLMTPTTDQDALDAATENMLLLHIFGGLMDEGKGGMSATELQQAHEWIQSVYKNGKTGYAVMAEALKMKWEGWRGGIVSKLGAATSDQATDRINKDKGVHPGDFAAQMIDGLFNIHQQMVDLLGQDHPVTKYFSTSIRHAREKTKLEVHAEGEALYDWMKTRLGIKSKARQAIALGGLSKQVVSPVSRTVGKKVVTDEVSIDLARQIIDGTATDSRYAPMSGEFKTLGEELKAYDDALAKFEADPNSKGRRPERKYITVDRVTDPGTTSRRTMSQLDAINDTLIWQQERYKESSMERHGLGQEYIDQVEAWLTPEAKSIREFIRTRYGAEYDGMNRTFRALFNINMPQEKNYARAGFITPGVNTEATGPDGLAMAPSGMSIGSIKGRMAHKAEPKRQNALTVRMSHVAQIAHWKAAAEVGRDLRAVFSPVAVRDSIVASRGEKTYTRLMTAIQTFEQGGWREAMGNMDGHDMIQSLMGTGVANALGANISSIMAQAPAAIVGMTRLGPKTWLKAARKVAMNPTMIADAYRDNVLRLRKGPVFSKGQIYSMLSGENGSIVAQNLVRAGELGVEVLGDADAMLTSINAAIAYAGHLDQLKGMMPAAEAQAMAADRMRETIEESAQPDDFSRKSNFENQIAASKGLLMMPVRGVFMFKSAARAASANIFLTMKQVAKKDISPTEGAGRMLALVVVIPALEQVMRSVYKDLFSDDPDEDLWMDPATWWVAMLSSFFSGVPGAGSIQDIIKVQVMGGYTVTVQDPATRLVSDSVKTISKLVKEEKLDINAVNAAAHTAALGLSAFGLPGGSAIESGLNLVKAGAGLVENLKTTDAEKDKKEIDSDAKKAKSEAKARARQEAGKQSDG